MTKTVQKSHPAYSSKLLAPLVLVVGDPQRAADASLLMDNPTEIWNRREYRAFSGTYRGQQVTVCSHGVGAGGAAYIFENLLNGGVQTIIRAGTCGSMIRGVPAGALMIGTGAVRQDGVSSHIVPIEYPAVADYQVVLALEEAAVENDFKDRHTGLIMTSAVFFPGPFNPPQYEKWSEAGIIAVEMEFAPLLVLASVHGAKAGGLFIADGNTLDKKNSEEYNPDQLVVEQGKKAMLKIGLDALVKLA